MRVGLSILSAAFLACASSAPLPTRYLLPADVPPGSARVDAPVRVGIATVSVAPYLVPTGLAVETESRQIRTARQHEWAEPLAVGVRRQLRASVSRALGYDVSADATERRQWDRVVDVSIERLHGTLEGEAVLVASWRVTPRGPGAEAATYRLSRTQPLPRAGYAGLVDAEVALIDGLAEEIAASLAAGSAVTE